MKQISHSMMGHKGDTSLESQPLNFTGTAPSSLSGSQLSAADRISVASSIIMS